jgi:hypothetical protein
MAALGVSMSIGVSSATLDTAARMLEEFASDCSMDSALRISVFYDEVFPDDDNVFSNLVIATSCYKPYGGKLLFDKDTIQPKIDRAKRRLTGVRNGEVHDYHLV